MRRPLVLDNSVRIVSIEYKHVKTSHKVYDLKVAYEGFADKQKEIKKALLAKLKSDKVKVTMARWLYQRPHLWVVTEKDERLYVVYHVSDK